MKHNKKAWNLSRLTRNTLRKQGTHQDDMEHNKKTWNKSRKHEINQENIVHNIMNTWNTSRIYETNEKISRLTSNTSRKHETHQKHMKLIKTNKEHIKKIWSTSRCEYEEEHHETHQETHESYQD